MRRWGIFAVLVVLTDACSAPAPMHGDGWRQAGGLDDDMVPFVEIEAARAKDGEVYRDAINHLCGPGRCVQVGFFGAGDAIPPSSSRARFFGHGGWSNYRPLSVYMGGEFTKWDCDRAGEEAAPLSALCGEGAEEQYDAVLRLATRDGWVKGCGLPPFGGRKLVERYSAGLPQARREQVRSAYEQMASESETGPDDPGACETLRPDIERKAEEAKAILKSAIGAKQSASSDLEHHS